MNIIFAIAGGGLLIIALLAYIGSGNSRKPSPAIWWFAGCLACIALALVL